MDEAMPATDFDECYGAPTIYVNRAWTSLARKVGSLCLCRVTGEL